jgi:hypothetical protein
LRLDTVEAAYQQLFEQVRRYAVELEYLDPDNRNAEQAITNVLLNLSSADACQDRLHLLNRARLLMGTVAETKRQKRVRTRLVTFFSLMFSSFAVFIVHTVHRAL